MNLSEPEAVITADCRPGRPSGGPPAKVAPTLNATAAATKLGIRTESRMVLGTEELVEAFIACTLPKEHWTHHAHLRVGLWHLLRHHVNDALALLRERIQKYNVSCGRMNTDHSGYHETITRFYVWVIGQFLRSADRSRGIDQLAEELIRHWGEKELPLRYYSRARLFSVLAGREWVEPDLAPLENRPPA